MNVQNVIDAWNKQADKYNQWDNLGAEEQVEFTLKLCQDKQIVMTETIHTAPIVGSSNAISCGWKNGTLAVEFKSGVVYHYFDVPVKVYGALMLAESFGKYLNKEIKPRYKCEKQ